MVPANLTPEQIAFLPVTALATLIESKRITSTELTKIYLDRLKKHGDTLKCVVTLTEELALKQAAEADAEIKAGKYRGPLHGIPWGAKDLLATKGIKTTWGATPYKDQVIDLDATVVERLRDAGAVLVAKLSMGALAQGGVWFGGSTQQSVEHRAQLERIVRRPGRGDRGGTRRLRDRHRDARLDHFAVGHQRRHGLRPTYGRVSRYGAMALSLDDGQDWTDVPIGRRLRAGAERDLRQRRQGRHRARTHRSSGMPGSAARPRMKIGYIQKEFEARRTSQCDAGAAQDVRARATRCMPRRSTCSARPARSSSR